MVNLDFYISINNILYDQDLIVDVFLNDVLIISLSNDFPVVSTQVRVDKYKNNKIIIRKRPIVHNESISLFKKMLSVVFAFVIFANECVDRFQFTYEHEEIIEFDVIDDNPEMHINCVQIKSNQEIILEKHIISCDYVSYVNEYINQKELYEEYSERRNFIVILSSSLFLLLIGVSIFAAFFNNASTIFFCVLIMVLIFGSSYYSISNLKRLYNQLKELNKNDRENNG